MSIRQLFKHTAIYGLATVMPRLLNLVLTPLHTSARTLSQAQYGLYQGLFAYMILGNVLLTYGMETAFFRFMNREEDPKRMAATCLTSLVVTTLVFLGVGLLLSQSIAVWLSYPAIYIRYMDLSLGRNGGDSLCLVSVFRTITTLCFYQNRQCNGELGAEPSFPPLFSFFGEQGLPTPPNGACQ